MQRRRRRIDYVDTTLRNCTTPVIPSVCRHTFERSTDRRAHAHHFQFTGYDVTMSLADSRGNLAVIAAYGTVVQLGRFFSTIKYDCFWNCFCVYIRHFQVGKLKFACTVEDRHVCFASARVKNAIKERANKARQLQISFKKIKGAAQKRRSEL